jgi:hypothetical protein
VKVDIEFWPKNKLTKRIEKYPYLSYPYVEEKILYDSEDFAKNIQKRLKLYFKKNPEISKEWKKWLKAYLTAKNKGIKRTDKEKVEECKEFYDRLELKFSKEGKITRNF